MPNESPSGEDSQSRGYAAVILVLIAVMAGLALGLPVRLGRAGWVWTWIISLILMFVVMGIAGIGLGAKDRFWAVFVDSRNMVSLSRFQIILWTLVVLSAFWTIGLARVGDYWFGGHADRYVWQASESTFDSPLEAPESEQEPPDEVDEEEPGLVGPLELKLPAVLWALMGISVTSAVASPLIKQDKKQRTTRTEADQRSYERMLDRTLSAGDSEDASDDEVQPEPQENDEFYTKGAVVYRKEGYAPQFFDLFRGEDPESIRYMDVGKVQNFFFTIIAVVTYALAIGAAIGAAGSIASLFEFPDVSEGLLAVLGISHTGYLVNKAINTPPPTTE